jgi:predicted nucleotide-binding protein
VARFLERLGTEVVILHEQPNGGRTIIEKFEDYSDVRYAVVLLTPDDVGASQNDLDDLLPRARQNVIFELGFFIGALGRERVCALHKGDLQGEIEIPSDFSGVIWIRMDSEGAWQFKLAREIKAAGFLIDLNRLV